jgi:hypothetical protein
MSVVTTVRFGVDLWRLLEAEAALSGVSASQYIREAALAWAGTGACARGEDPLALLAGAPHSAPTQTPRETAACLRDQASDLFGENVATQAQSRQSVRRSSQLQQEAASLRKQPRPSRVSEAERPN